MHKHLLSIAILLALGACSDQAAEPVASAPAAAAAGEAATVAQSEPTAADRAEQLDQLYVDFWDASLELNPLRATFVGESGYNDRLPNFLAPEYIQKTQAFERDWLARARAIGSEGLEGQDLLSYQIFVREREGNIEGFQFPGHLVPINQFYNFAAMAVMLGSGTGAQPFKTVEDYDNWLKRAAAMPAIFDQAIANMKEGVEAGVVQPRVLMEKTVPQIEAQIVDDVEQSMFWRPIANFPDDISETERDRLQQAYRALITQQLMPAYARLRDYIRDEYMPHTRDSVGLSAQPNGEDWYAHNVRKITTTDLTPDQIHQIGLDEVARIQAQMREVMAEVGFEGELSDFFEHVTTDPQFTFDSEEALLTAYRALEDRVNQKVPELFSLTPKAGFEIRPVEAFRAASAAGGSYQGPSEDGSRPGIFYVNTYDLPVRKRWDMDALFLHEAIPGHHFQIALQQELTDLPKFRRFGGETAYIEGWGLYAESLGRELDLYADPYAWFGRLQAELWRAIRLVVDTGLHSKGWSREQVINYMLENSATTNTEAVSETERYIAIPGQALAYKVGELKILELRRKAKEALGERFDIRGFHAEVLKDGSVPLDVLERKIERWIESQKVGSTES